MREEKDLLVNEYSDRRNETESQVSQLLATIGQLKSETQLIHNKHEEDKLTISCQLRTIREQEEALQKVAHQKDAELQKYKESFEAAEEARRKQENQIRNYADTLNSKIQLLH